MNLPDEATIVAGAETLELRYPWLVRESIQELEQIIKPGMEVLEFGSGGSTLFFEDLGVKVTCFESDKLWLDSVNEHIKHTPVKLITEFNISNFKEKSIDVLSVDSNPQHTDRLSLLKLCLPLVKSGGYLIIDNYGAFGMEALEYPEDWEVKTYNNPFWTGWGTKIVKVK